MTTSLDKVPSRIYAQYRNKPKVVAWLEILDTLAEGLVTAIGIVRNQYSIDDMEGAQLDIIGRVINLTRNYEGAITFTPNRWGQSRSKACFGKKGTMFRNTTGTAPMSLTNSIFRKLIKAKIIRNTGTGTIENVASCIAAITELPFSIVDNEDYTFSIIFIGHLDAVTKYVFNNFDILPRHICVNVSSIVEKNVETTWGGISEFGDGYTDWGQLDEL